MSFKWLIVPILAAVAVASHAGDDAVLDRTLVRLSRVAELYRDNALGFACEETIVYSGAETGRMKFAYLFIRDKNGRLRDFRTWKGAKSGEEVNPSDYRVPRYLESAYLWVFIFRTDRQPLYRFERLPDETLGRRAAIVIKFTPREPIRKGLNDWAGSARIDSETSQILEVEAFSPDDWERKTRRDAAAATTAPRDARAEPSTYDIEKVITKFGFEKNGMRFPSRVTISETRTTVVPRGAHAEVWDTPVRKLVQSYAKFEFFSVRSSAEIKRFVNGDGALATVP